MAAVPPGEIVSAIADAFAESGSSAVLVSDKEANPRRFYIVAGESAFPVWVYIWTLTHGGGAARPRDEYRIQLTGVSPPLPENPDGPTLLVGYERDTKCFVGFDLRKHRVFSPKSPSIQVNINTLRNAVRDGFAFARKGNDEIAIGFRPDNILAYALNAESLHGEGAGAGVSDALNRVVRQVPLAEDETSAIPVERQRVVAKVSRLVRDSDFRRKVTVAYDRKCAVTGLQLRLIDAAHIVPVGADGSTDEVTNGICLSPTYHRAYDRGLIFLSDDYRMRINRAMKRDLTRLGLDGGWAEFEAHLGREIFLPPDRRQWPKHEYILAAKIARGFR
ncbi:MAG: HNH endonuclease [Lentisphaerae bacterium]|nr:HNH endonuclease [Lentisphaerota bacterium]